MSERPVDRVHSSAPFPSQQGDPLHSKHTVITNNCIIIFILSRFSWGPKIMYNRRGGKRITAMLTHRIAGFFEKKLASAQENA
jgi:hypothetical protein